jgi:hypothetical protein
MRRRTRTASGSPVRLFVPKFRGHVSERDRAAPTILEIQWADDIEDLGDDDGSDTQRVVEKSAAPTGARLH